MINGIGIGLGTQYHNPYSNQYNASIHGSQSTPRVQHVAPIPQAQPDLPVQPVEAAKKVQSAPLDKAGMLMRLECDPVAMSVRNRIQYVGEAETAKQAEKAQSPQELMEETECQTCAERKYQDGSDDPGVSFKTAAHIDPNQAASVVRGHEQEHVVREQAKADREGREVVSQSVTLHTAICPECGRSYVSGGTTRTVTQSNQAGINNQKPEEQQTGGFSAVA